MHGATNLNPNNTMATDNKVPLTESWVEMGDGPITLRLISGSVFWVYVGPTAPANDDNYMPVQWEGPNTFFSYGGTEKVFAKTGQPISNIDVKLSVLEIV